MQIGIKLRETLCFHYHFSVKETDALIKTISSRVSFFPGFSTSRETGIFQKIARNPENPREISRA